MANDDNKGYQHLAGGLGQPVNVPALSSKPKVSGGGEDRKMKSRLLLAFWDLALGTVMLIRFLRQAKPDIAMIVLGAFFTVLGIVLLALCVGMMIRRRGSVVDPRFVADGDGGVGESLWDTTAGTLISLALAATLMGVVLGVLFLVPTDDFVALIPFYVVAGSVIVLLHFKLWSRFPSLPARKQ